MGIVVVGSLNMDLVVRVARHPVPGETLLGSDYESYFGGKGANQAVAAQRMGGKVRMIGRVGNDGFGERIKTHLKAQGINVNATICINAPTGVAFISVDKAGQNVIIVSPGANSRLKPENLSPIEFEHTAVVMLQLEVPLDTVRRAARIGRESGARVILNAAPALPLSPADLALFDILVVNESEAQAYSGLAVDSPESGIEAARKLRQHCPTVIVTLGAQGAVWASAEGEGYQSAFEVRAVDTTAAGDAFMGALAVSLSEGRSLERAIRLGAAAGALAVTRPGAQTSLPTRLEVEAFLSERSA
ncbi:ribokinase [Calidithermus roseus]|uniref:Ribokinase n=1 Tax=Calidithermus roseus TaxID=1644118 RepID=A0A399ENR7_9DEIN|nr:ribokinase [Calidithermus roseus]RIH85163.1 Ribokinase [Calidithermus roseus]